MDGESKSRTGAVRIWRNARLATMAEGAAGLGIVEQGSIVARDGRIIYAGPEADMPAALGPT
ncbi:MAG: imidazolonepropionase, partial [Mesorhizobium sp.]